MQSRPSLIKATTPRLNRWIPFTPHPKQAAFLLLGSSREVLFGGAAGGGKTAAILMAAAQYADVPGYSAILFRRTFPQLSGKGGLIPLSHEWWGNTAARWSQQRHTWTFPSGAVIAFGHLQYDTTQHNYQGHEFQFIGFDELTHFTEGSYLYLQSRLRRRAGTDVPLRVRATANPGGAGHMWVKARFIDNPDPPRRILLRSYLEDNPSLDQEDYDRTLAGLGAVTHARLRRGDWDIVEEGPLWGPDHFPAYDMHPRELLEEHKRNAVLLSLWDCKGKLHTSRKVRAGESYVSGLMFLDPGDGNLYLLDEEHGAWGLDDTVSAFYRLAARWPSHAHHYAEDKALGPELIKRARAGDKALGRKAIPVMSHNPQGSKEVRYERIQPYVWAKRIWVPNKYHCPWVEECVAEWARAPAAPNDRTDTLVMAVEKRLIEDFDGDGSAWL